MSHQLLEPFLVHIRIDGFEVPTALLVILLKTFIYSAICSTVALVYFELMYLATRYLYFRGFLKRYAPLDSTRHISIVFWSLMSAFLLPIFTAVTCQSGMERSFAFNPVSCCAHTLLYMAIHDVLFFYMHFAMHKFHSLHLVYKYVHAMHHDAVHLMNAYAIGYADFGDDLLTIGVPWAIWTLIAGSNWWNWMLPFSFMLSATYIGHSGYRSASPWFTLFNPLFLPIMLMVGKQALSPADHQVHHTYRRYNFGLFLRLLDKWHKTYKKSDKIAYDVHYWKKWVRVKENRDSLANNKWEAGIKFEELAI
ncbi:hypothetical protein VF21_05888 [Pseudogymnoascus sp. 05NY08]|nr:hypothetical protein VF21_05888 [Pseudogymnoascus sp. 05NY08]